MQRATFFLILIAVFLPRLALAHEAYVLSPETFEAAYGEEFFNILDVLRDPAALRLFLVIALGTAILIFGAGVLRRSLLARSARERLLRHADLGRLLLRLAAGTALVIGGFEGSMFGPEIPLAPPFGYFAIGAGILLFMGLATELAAGMGIFLFCIALFSEGAHVLGYAEWLGVMAVFFLFGDRRYSLDRRLFGPARRFAHLRVYEPAILRIAFGFALVYGAVAIKILHPLITLTVIEQYHLASIPLFPSDPFLVLLGVALMELTVGLFILAGFAMRGALLVAALSITGAFLVFDEPAWPHLILYGLAIALFFAPEKLALDEWIDRRIERGRA